MFIADTPWAGMAASPPSLDSQLGGGSSGGAPLSESPKPHVRRTASRVSSPLAATQRPPAKLPVHRSGSSNSFSCWSEDSSALSDDSGVDFSDEDSAALGGGRDGRAPPDRQGEAGEAASHMGCHFLHPDL